MKNTSRRSASSSVCLSANDGAKASALIALASKELIVPNLDLRQFYARYIDAINARRFDEVTNVVDDHVTMNGVPHRREEILASLRGITDAVPDFVWTVQDLLVDGDRIAAGLRDSGTPTKEFLGQQPTGVSFEMMEFASYRVRDGKFVEMWFLMDAVTLAEQLAKRR